MLKVRVLSAVVGLPLLVLGMLYLPSFAVSLFFMACVGISVFETNQMILPKLLSHFNSDSAKAIPPKFHLFLTLSIASFIFIYSTAAVEVGSGRGILVGGLLACVFVGTFTSSDTQISGAAILSSLLAITYGVLPWISIWDLYLMGENAMYLFYLLALVWAGDTGAYFGGRFLGKHKLAPIMSPKKTWEGAIAGLVSSLLAGLTCRFFYGPEMMSWEWCVVASLSCGIVGQMGDLVESNIKRFCGVKDSGGLIPGHGGLLDRADGLLFAGPTLWFILYSILN